MLHCDNLVSKIRLIEISCRWRSRLIAGAHGAARAEPNTALLGRTRSRRARHHGKIRGDFRRNTGCSAVVIVRPRRHERSTRSANTARWRQARGRAMLATLWRISTSYGPKYLIQSNARGAVGHCLKKTAGGARLSGELAPGFTRLRRSVQHFPDLRGGSCGALTRFSRATAFLEPRRPAELAPLSDPALTPQSGRRRRLFRNRWVLRETWSHGADEKVSCLPTPLAPW